MTQPSLAFNLYQQLLFRLHVSSPPATPLPDLYQDINHYRSSLSLATLTTNISLNNLAYTTLKRISVSKSLDPGDTISGQPYQQTQILTGFVPQPFILPPIEVILARYKELLSDPKTALIGSAAKLTEIEKTSGLLYVLILAQP